MANPSMNRKLTDEQHKTLLKTLRTRFDKNTNRHMGLVWADVQTRLEANPQKLWSLYRMEETGGEPDVIATDENTGEFLFCDCAAESPKGRRSLCYDREALESRKNYPPENNVLDVAADMGIELLTTDQYRDLQKLGKFDQKTSSWLLTPPEIRKHGGAIFGDFRYNTVFIYHNGADSYYAVRGFRGSLRV